LFNVIVKARGWADARDTIEVGRVFEHTSDDMKEQFSNSGSPRLEALRELPTLFMEESFRSKDPCARVGMLVRATRTTGKINLEYFFDPDVPVLRNSQIETVGWELGIANGEFTRTHWAVKEQDLFRVLFRHFKPRRSQPEVFRLEEPEITEDVLVSAMMPFQAEFDAVHHTLKMVSEANDLKCRRADDIWENPAIIQDVVSLIDKSRVVICDCTGRNANVFYEAGIAHTLGREVILITQNPEDIPFDLRHLRYVHYLNNEEGRKTLYEKLEKRIRTIIEA